jgi:phospholipid transport system substrate-binding protein
MRFNLNDLARRLVLAMFVAAGALAATPALADKQAESFISGVLREANPVFAQKEASARNAGIDALVAKYVDLDRTGQFVLGQYARAMTPQQKAAYKPLFRDYATRVYRKTLEGYQGETLAVTGSVDRSAKDIIVNSKVVGAAANSPYARSVIMWRVYRGEDGKMTIFDAGADNVWLAIEQQSQFKAVIANNGGGAKGIDALIDDLKQRLTR